MFYDIFDYMSDEEKEALKNFKRVDMSGELSTFPKKTSLLPPLSIMRFAML